MPSERDPAPISPGDRLLWGWIRFALALVQMTFAAAGIYLFLHDGLHWPVVAALAFASFATAISRYLYGGRSGPSAGARKGGGEGGRHH